MFPFFKKKEIKLEKRGYLLVVTYENGAAVNYVFNRADQKFNKKKIFAANTIQTENYFNDVNEMISEIDGHREYKRFLAGGNVTGIFYVETKVELSDDTYVSKTTSVSFFYVPSKLKLEVMGSSVDHKISNKRNNKKWSK